LWEGALADQLGEKDVFAPLYTPLQAPGVTSWIHLLKGDPTLILLDELPPYFSASTSVSVGASDLSGMSYAQSGANINTALDDFERETRRGAVRLEPVATTGDDDLVPEHKDLKVDISRERWQEVADECKAEFNRRPAFHVLPAGQAYSGRTRAGARPCASRCARTR